MRDKKDRTNKDDIFEKDYDKFSQKPVETATRKSRGQNPPPVILCQKTDRKKELFFSKRLLFRCLPSLSAQQQGWAAVIICGDMSGLIPLT